MTSIRSVQMKTINRDPPPSDSVTPDVTFPSSSMVTRMISLLEVSSVLLKNKTASSDNYTPPSKKLPSIEEINLDENSNKISAPSVDTDPPHQLKKSKSFAGRLFRKKSSKNPSST